MTESENNKYEIANAEQEQEDKDSLLALGKKFLKNIPSKIESKIENGNLLKKFEEMIPSLEAEDIKKRQYLLSKMSELLKAKENLLNNEFKNFLDALWEINLEDEKEKYIQIQNSLSNRTRWEVEKYTKILEITEHSEENTDNEEDYSNIKATVSQVAKMSIRGGFIKNKIIDIAIDKGVDCAASGIKIAGKFFGKFLNQDNQLTRMSEYIQNIESNWELIFYLDTRIDEFLHIIKDAKAEINEIWEIFEPIISDFDNGLEYNRKILNKAINLFDRVGKALDFKINDTDYKFDYMKI